jgi:hypothetical protein
MMASEYRPMSKELQIKMLKEIFRKLNPEADEQVIDWEATLDPTLTFPENRINFSNEYPAFRWFETDTALKENKKIIIDDLKDYLDYLLSLIPEEIKEDMKKIFDDYITKTEYVLERKLSISPLKKKIAQLEKELKLKEVQAKDIVRRERTEESKPKVYWSKQLEEKLKDLFLATLLKAGVKSPSKFLPELRIEFDVIKTLPTEEDMMKAVEALAQEVIERETTPKIRFEPVAPPITPPRIREPYERFIEEEEPSMYPEPKYPERSLSEMPFPRRPAGIEIDQIRPKFLHDLMNCGIYNAEQYLPYFQKYFEEVLFKSWEDMRAAYETLVDQICRGMPPVYPSAHRALPYESICEGVYWLVSLKQYKSAEEIAAALGELGTPASTETVKSCIRTGWTEKVPNFAIVTKQYLEQLIKEPLD